MNYSIAIMEKAPESLKALINSEEDYTSDWDSYSDSEEEPFAIEGPQVFILEESNDLYNKMEIGMSKSQIIAIMGEPDNSNTYDKTEYMYWDDEHLNSYSVTIEDDKVTRKKRDLYSDSYDSIQLSTELGTEIEDLNLIVSQVEDDMTLKEVEGILGDKYFENEIYDDGEVEYTWYDKQENYVSVSFEDGKVWYVGSVGDSY
jgi:hypothetical protein